jgi:hypothetical protein
LEIDTAGGIVKEDSSISGAEVGIEVGDDPAEMDGIAVFGLIVAEAVRFTRCCDRGKLAIRVRCGNRSRLACRRETNEEQSRSESGPAKRQRALQPCPRASRNLPDLAALCRIQIPTALSEAASIGS